MGILCCETVKGAVTFNIKRFLTESFCQNNNIEFREVVQGCQAESFGCTLHIPLDYAECRPLFRASTYVAGDRSVYYRLQFRNHLHCNLRMPCGNMCLSLQ